MYNTVQHQSYMWPDRQYSLKTDSACCDVITFCLSLSRSCGHASLKNFLKNDSWGEEMFSLAHGKCVNLYRILTSFVPIEIDNKLQGVSHFIMKR